MLCAGLLAATSAHTTAAECASWTGPQLGYIADHQVGTSLFNVSLLQCRQHCDATPACQSVDYSPLEAEHANASMCNLRDCSAGDNAGCALHAPSPGHPFSSYTCDQRHTRGNPTPAPAPAPGVQVLPAADAKVDWAGRRAVNGATGAVSFDWLGVSARVEVVGASYVRVNVSGTAARGTRMRAYGEQQGFLLYPTVQLWVERDPAFALHTLWAGGVGGSSFAVTLENIVAPQYGTGVTTVHAFVTDGQFVAVPDTKRFGGGGGGGGGRNIEFIGDSITAATNVVRPPGAPSCGDGGYQSDWSQTYEAQLCHRFGASCSTIAVGGKCVMRECGGLQMPDYFTGLFYGDGATPTYDFGAGGGWKPDAMFIDLGTNDERVIARMGSPAGPDAFIAETVAFMVNATVKYAKPDIVFFLNAGPMENVTMPWTVEAIAQANARGLNATFVNMSTACWASDEHGAGNSDFCDGCAGHPGIQGHRNMYEAAWPVMAQVMGWE
jgi:hypothetical protein